MSMPCRRIMLMGPMPPPDHGTSVPFRLLVETVQQCPGAEVRVINTQSGDKAGVPLYSPRAFMPFLGILRQAAVAAFWCDSAISYGSQRYSCTVAALVTVMLRLLGKPMHVRVAGGGFDNYYFELADWKRLLIRWALRRAESVVVETKLVGRRMAVEFPNNMTVMANWIDLHGFVPQGRAPQATGPLRFCFVAEIRAEKGVATLLDAFQQVRPGLVAAGIDASLELVGPVRPDFACAFATLLDRRGAGVTHRGQMAIEDLVPWIARQDVLVLPTIFTNEGYPGVMLEALALGVPLIVSRWRALPEVVVHEHNGLLCEPGDTASLAHQMNLLARDPVLRARLGRQAAQDGAQFRAVNVLRPLLELSGLASSESS